MNIKIKELENSLIKLEPLVGDHAFEMYDGLCDERIYEFIESDIPESLEWLEKQFKIIEAREIISKKGQRLLLYDWAIRIKEDNQVAGRVEFTIFPDGICNVAYILFPNFWRKGIAYQAVKLGLNFLDGHPEIETFKIACDTWNLASQRMAHKLKFVLVGIEPGVNPLKNRIGDDSIYHFANNNKGLNC